MYCVVKNLVNDGVLGFVVCGMVGENMLLLMSEKLQVIEVVCDVVGGKILVIVGIVEFMIEFVCNMVCEVQCVGVDGVMVMFVFVYLVKLYEIVVYFCVVVMSIDLLVMVYNNLLIYKNDVMFDVLIVLQDCENIVCFKDLLGDMCCFIDLCNVVGDCFVLFVGFDDVVVESIVVGVEGWVLGMLNVFLKEGEMLFCFVKQKCFDEVFVLYCWFMLLLYFDVCFDFVQCIKLCEELVGCGSVIMCLLCFVL